MQKETFINEMKARGYETKTVNSGKVIARKATPPSGGSRSPTMAFTVGIAANMNGPAPAPMQGVSWPNRTANPGGENIQHPQSEKRKTP